MKFIEELIDAHTLNKEAQVASKLIGELNSKNVVRDAYFDANLADLISELHDNGIEIGSFLNSSRRIVFDATLNNRKVVVKFTHARDTFDHDEYQQQKEELVWEDAKNNDFQNYFAEILFVNKSSLYVFQEFCTDLQSVSDEEDVLDPVYKSLVDRYSIKEILLGKNSKNNLVFVDYGM